MFGYLKKKVKANIRNWNEKNLSKPSKEILIKMVAQSFPSFAMNVFLLPLGVIREIEKELTRFYWKTSQNSTSQIHWMAWERLTRHKHVGGLGFKSLRDFNLAMLAKQCWRLITNPESLVARIYKAKYYADSDFMQAKLGGSPSFILRSIMEARSVITAGSVWRIGTGKDIQILHQPWLNNVENPYVLTNSHAIVNQNVASLFVTGTTNWDVDVIADIFQKETKTTFLIQLWSKVYTLTP